MIPGPLQPIQPVQVWTWGWVGIALLTLSGELGMPELIHEGMVL